MAPQPLTLSVPNLSGIYVGGVSVVPLATFTSSNPLARTSDFYAIVDWGYNRSSAVVVRTPSGFAVYGQIGGTTSSLPASFPFTVTVFQGNNSYQGQAVANIMLADHSEYFPTNVSNRLTLSGYTFPYTKATFSFGDGTTADVPLTHQGTTLHLSSSQVPAHVYSKPGRYTQTYTAYHDGDGAPASVSDDVVIAMPPFQIVNTLPAISRGNGGAGMVGTSLTDRPLAILRDPDPSASSNRFSAIIDWGDGQASDGTVVSLPDSTYEVLGSHSYAHSGTYHVEIVARRSDGTAGFAETNLEIVDNSLIVRGQVFGALAGVTTGTLTVATLTDPNIATGDVVASVDWGDVPYANPAVATLVPVTSGEFAIQGSHIYKSPGKYLVRVWVTEGKITTALQETVTVSAGGLAGQGFAEDPDEAEILQLGEAGIALDTGGLRVDQPLGFDRSPGTDVGRDPALAYNSDTVSVRPVVEATWQSDPNGPVPTAIQVQLTWDGGTPQPAVTFSTAGHRPGDAYLLAVQLASPETRTGLHTWTLHVHAVFASGPAIEAEVSGTARVVVDDGTDPSQPDPYGPGWGIDGVARLAFACGGVLWVDGDGDSRFFASGGNGAFVSPAGEFGTLVQDLSNYSFTFYVPSSYAPDRTVWHFDANGRLLSIVDPHGLAVTYTYDGSGRLINVATPDGGVTTLTYAGGLLATIQEPGTNRVVTLTRDGGGNLTGIADVDGTTRSLSYDGQHHLTGDRWDPLVVTFAYDPNTSTLTSADRGGGATYAINASAAVGLASNPAASSSRGVAVVTDPLGNATTYTLDAEGRLLRRDQPDGISEAWSRNGQGLVAQYTDPVGSLTTYTYDGIGNLASVRSPDGGTETFVFNYNEEILDVDPLSHSTRASYDYTTGDRLTTTDATGAVTTYTWSGGLLRTVTEPANAADGLARTTTYLYDSARRLQAVVDPLGDRTTYTYDAARNLASTTDAQGLVTTTVYNGRNRLISETDPGTANLEPPETTTYAYDAEGDRVGETDPMGVVTRWIYDPRGRLAEVEEAVGQSDQAVTTYAYDAAGNLTSVTDPLGRETDYGYDADDRRIWTRSPESELTTTAYDPAGDIVSRVDARGVEIDYAYDLMGRRVGDVEAAGTPDQRATTTIYDRAGDVVSVIDGRGIETDYAYDADLRLVSVTEAANTPSPVSTHTSYDADGDVASTVDARGFETDYAYDADDRVVQATRGANTSTPLVEYTYYDADGDVASTVDARGVVTTYAYDAEGRRIGTTVGAGSTLPETTSTLYDADGDVATTVDARGAVTVYRYDDRGREVSATEAFGTPLQRTTATAYDADGDVVATVDARGVATTYAYNGDGRLVATTEAAGTALARTTTKAYDADGDVLFEADARGYVTTYQYDKLDRPVATTEAAGTAVARTTSSAYDADDDVTSETDALGVVTTYQYDALNRLIGTTRGAGTAAPLVTATSYDADGNVLSEADADGVTTTYAYDGEGRRVGTTEAAGTSLARTTADAYDGDGNLVSEVDPRGVLTTYAYDPENREVGVTEAAGDPARRVTTMAYDAAGDLVSEAETRAVRGVAQAVTTLTAYDLLGRPVAVTEAAGTPDQRVTTTAYDADDDVVATIDPRGVEADTSYDALDRATTVVQAAGTSVQRTLLTAYDADDDVVRSVDGMGREADTSYDALDRATTVVQAVGTPVRRTLLTAYDADDDVVDSVDGAGLDTRTAYDPFGRAVAVTRAAGTSLARTTSTAYDGDGHVTSSTDPLNHTTTYAYDALGRQVASTDPDGGHTATSYDADDDVLALTDPDGNTTTYAYDALGREVASTDPLGHADSSAYDASGDLVSTTDRDGQVRAYRYDALGRDVAETWKDAGGNVSDSITKAYDAAGDLLTAADHAGTVTCTYDALGRVSTRQGTAGGVLAYTYDADDEVTSVQDSGGGLTTSAYDALGRLQTRQLTTPGTAAPTFAAASGLTSSVLTVTGVVVDAAGDTYLTGSFGNTVNFATSGPAVSLTAVGITDVFLAAYSPLGALLWARDLAGTAGKRSQGNTLALDDSGNILVGGQFAGSVNFNPAGSAMLSTTSPYAAFIAGYDASGHYRWALAFDNGLAEAVNSLAVDASGEVFAAGTFFGAGSFGKTAGGTTVTLPNAGSSDGFALKLDAARSTVWATDLGGAAADQDKRIAVDPAGMYLYVAGTFSNTASFGTNSLTSAGFADVYLARLGANGSVGWAMRMGGPSYDTLGGLAVDAAGNAVVGGITSGPATFGNGQTYATTSPFGFLVKVGPSATVLWVATCTGNSSSACAGFSDVGGGCLRGSLRGGLPRGGGVL